MDTIGGARELDVLLDGKSHELSVLLAFLVVPMVGVLLRCLPLLLLLAFRPLFLKCFALSRLVRNPA